MRLGVEAAVVDSTLVPGDVDVSGGRIEAVGLGGRGRGVAVAGLVDLHVHGFGGVDFAGADAAGWRTAAEALAAAGTTSFQPTFVTAPVADLEESLRAVPGAGLAAHVLGCHLEGPFISPRRLGMHPADARLDPDARALERLLAAGPVTEMTLAPELPGAHALVETLVARGVVVSCGHSDATAAEAHDAFDLGARAVTHLFNAMRPFAHRDPGLAGAALARDDVVCELILDGHHVAAEAAAVAWRAAACTASVTSATPVEVRGGVARRLDGVLAGSVLSLLDSVRNLVRLGVAVEAAVDAASRVPARLLRRPGLGSIAPGCPADVLVLDGDLELVRVLVGGVERT
ncbi:MAG TPA: amidohydrolase family protein [Gaiellaceae bacterium]|nr:amidohydrolase family protein [Gaiellaceae bacterium]